MVLPFSDISTYDCDIKGQQHSSFESIKIWMAFFYKPFWFDMRSALIGIWWLRVQIKAAHARWLSVGVLWGLL